MALHAPTAPASEGLTGVAPGALSDRDTAILAASVVSAELPAAEAPIDLREDVEMKRVFLFVRPLCPTLTEDQVHRMVIKMPVGEILHIMRGWTPDGRAAYDVDEVIRMVAHRQMEFKKQLMTNNQALKLAYAVQPVVEAMVWVALKSTFAAAGAFVAAAVFIVRTMVVGVLVAGDASESQQRVALVAYRSSLIGGWLAFAFTLMLLVLVAFADRKYYVASSTHFRHSNSFSLVKEGSTPTD